MFAVWLRFGCALMCALALSLSEAAGGRARAAAAEEASAEWSRATKPGAAPLSGARGAWTCPVAAAAKTAPAHPLPVLAWVQAAERESRPRFRGRPLLCRLQTASEESRSRSGAVRLLI